MNEIIFESSGNIEHFTDMEYLQEDSLLQDDTGVQENSVNDQEEKIEDHEEDHEEDHKEDQEEEQEEKEEKEEEKEDEDIEIQYVYIKSDPVSISDDSGNNNNGEVVSIVSANDVQYLIDTPLNEYKLSDSLLLIIIMLILGYGLISLIKRSIFKWS